MKPIWYLDVDGVINIVRPICPHDVPEEHWRSAVVNGFRINWDQRVVDFLNDMHRQGVVEIVWLTTWESDAAQLLAPALELDQFRVPRLTAHDMPADGQRGWWKFSSILVHAEEDQLDERAVIWTDDDLSFSMGLSQAIHDWVAARKEAGLTTLGISPRTSRGLTMEHLDEIRKVCHADHP